MRASSASTNASKLSLLPPAALKRGRIAATWLGCTAITCSPASSSRSISSPSGRSMATSPHPELDQARAQRLDPALVMAIATALDDPAVAVGNAGGVLFAGPIDPGEATLTIPPFNR